MGKGRVFWGLLAVTLVVYALLVLVIGPPMQALTNGEPIPDLRVLGYGPSEMDRLMRAAEPGFAEAYAAVAQSWDRAVPVLFAVTFGLGIWRAGGVYRVLAVVPVLMGIADVTENTLATAMFRAGPDALDVAQVHLASLATQLKWGLFAVALGTLIASFFKKPGTGAAS